LLIETLKRDSIVATLKDSLEIEVLDSIAVDTTVMLYEGADSVPVEEVEKKIWKAVSKPSKKRKMDSARKAQKKIKN